MFSCLCIQRLVLGKVVKNQELADIQNSGKMSSDIK